MPQIPLTEFALNSSINNSSGFAPFKLNYGYMPRLTPFPTHNIKYHGVEEFAQQARVNLEVAHGAIIEAHVHSTYQTNKNRSEEKPFEVGDLAYLSTANLNLPKRHTWKLAPIYWSLQGDQGTSR
jgi:hypothetical protein